MSNKKAQVSETVTWIVATLVIIVVLVVFLYFSSILGKGKEITKAEIKSANSEGYSDWINQKNSFAYELSEQKYKRIIDEWRNAQDEG